MENFTGIILGLCSFLIIGLFHPIVIKGEYHFGVKIWWFLLLFGILGVIVSIIIDNLFWSVLAGIFAFSSFWGISEVFEQKKRVEKGWFPSKKIKNKKQ